MREFSEVKYFRDLFAYFSIHILSTVLFRPYRPNISHTVYYSPTNAQVIILKTLLKYTLNSSDMFRCNHTIVRELIIRACQIYTLLK